MMELKEALYPKGSSSKDTQLNSRQVFPPVLVKVFTAKMLEYALKLCRVQLLSMEVFIYRKVL